MNLKKNTFSYLTWIILLFFTGVTCTFFSLVLGQSIKINIVFIAAVIVSLFFGFLFLIYILTGRFISKRLPAKNYLGMEKLNSVLERIFFVTFLSIGFVVRIFMMSTASGEEAAYFEVSKVTEQGGITVNSVQGSVYFYCRLLHFVFRVFGNQWIAGIWLQIVLQLIGASVLYVALRNLMNRVASLTIFAIIMFTPFAIKAGLTYSPQMLYFCIFATAFYFVSLLLKDSSNNKTEIIIETMLAGIITGICCYVDITGIVLLIPVFCLVLLNRETILLKPIWQIIICVSVFLLGLFGALLLDSILSQTGMGNVIRAWQIIYGKLEWNLDAFIAGMKAEVLVLSLLCGFGCVSFWRRKKTEIFTPYIWMTVLCLFLVLAGVTTENMSGSYLLYVLISILAVVSVSELFYKEEQSETEIQDTEAESEKIVVDSNQENQKVEYIENPLPVPKKHIRKTMDYAFIPNESQMKYDIHVSDNDDFDLK